MNGRVGVVGKSGDNLTRNTERLQSEEMFLADSQQENGHLSFTVTGN